VALHEYGERDDVPTDAGYVAMACGAVHWVGLRRDGRVVCWGNDIIQQRDGAPTDAGFVSSVACGSYRTTVGLRNDGRVVTWGGQRDAQREATPTDDAYVSIACGRAHSCALHESGRVVCCGDSSQGQRVDVPSDAGYEAISCGRFHSCALREDGRVVARGNWDHQTVSEPTDAVYAEMRSNAATVSPSRCATTVVSSPGVRTVRVGEMKHPKTPATSEWRVDYHTHSRCTLTAASSPGAPMRMASSPIRLFGICVHCVQAVVEPLECQETG